MLFAKKKNVHNLDHQIAKTSNDEEKQRPFGRHVRCDGEEKKRKNKKKEEEIDLASTYYIVIRICNILISDKGGCDRADELWILTEAEKSIITLNSRSTTSYIVVACYPFGRAMSTELQWVEKLEGPICDERYKMFRISLKTNSVNLNVD